MDDMSSRSSLRRKLARVDAVLEGIYGVRERPDGQADPLDSLVLTILSQSTSDHNRDMAWQAMWKAFGSWEEVAAASPRKLARAIRSGGLANQKAAHILETLAWVRAEYGAYDLSPLCDMELGEARRTLVSLNGVGLKTACVVLTFSCGHDVFPLDTHIHRIMVRLGVVPEKMTREKAHGHMEGLVPPGKAFSMHLNVLQFGRDRCKARNPLCEGCPLRRMCLWVRANG